ncbi:MAG: solute carrier family 23 protein, partial [Archaeoglobaceae archaeon]
MELKHGVDDLPRISELLLISIQWLMIIAPILVIGGRIVAELHYDNSIEKIVYMQKVFLISGLGLILQVIFGHKLPLITGPAAVLIVGIYAALESGYETIYTSISICGILIFLLAITGKLEIVQRIFTQNVISLVFLLIAFSLSPLIIELLSSEDPKAWDFLFFILFTLILIILNSRLTGFWNSILVILAMFLGSIFYHLFHTIEIEFYSSKNLEFLHFISQTSFSPEIFLAFLLCYVALVVNDLSSMISLGKLLNVDKLERRVRRGIMITGLLNALSGFFGVIGPVNYAMSPGIIA